MKYMVSGHVTVSCHTMVEADSPEQAKEIAEERQLAGLTIQAFTGDDNESWHAEMDGAVEATNVQEMD